MKNRMIRITGITLTAGALLAVFAPIIGVVHWPQEPPYRPEKSWGGPGTEAGKFRDPTGIAVSDKRVFVADARNSRIQVFNKAGGFIHAFGQDSLERPMNLDIHENRLYVPDYFRDRIQVFRLDGHPVDSIAPPDGLNSPGGVVVRPDGSLLVADTYAHRVLHLTPDGKVRAIFGTANAPGSGAGEFRYPTDVALSADGGFYVADGYNHRIQQFDARGRPVCSWSGPLALGLPGPPWGWFSTVSSLATSPDGAVLAVDFHNQRIQKFTADGSFRTAFSVKRERHKRSVMALAVDAHGIVFATDMARHRVLTFSPGSGD